jgi:YfiR/HmsC-like
VVGVFQSRQEREQKERGANGKRNRWLLATVLAMAFGLLVSGTAEAQLSGVTAEYRNKANFLATFPSFIDWPGDAFEKAGSPFVMCVVGYFQFGTSLAEMTRSASAHGRRVEVRWVHKDQELRLCHLLFVSRSQSKRYAKVLQAVQGVDVLTVGETPDFLSAGGTISFSLQDEALQFEVNLLTASGAHLRMSSRLLALARRVVNKPEADKG